VNKGRVVKSCPYSFSEHPLSILPLKEHYDNRGQGKTFAGHYYAYNLVYYEYTKYVNNAIYREKEIKNMS
jgi:hypothetical protein